MQTPTADWTTGRWHWLLQSFGIDEKYLVDHHGPCPICEGKDRFRFDNKAGRGTWICNQCGNGDGFDLIQKVTGRGFRDIAKEIDRLKPGAPERNDEPFKPKIDVEQRRRILNSTWQSATDGELVLDYLRKRGVTRLDNLSDLRGHRDLYFRDRELGKASFPAMIGLIRNVKGEPVSIHRTYLLPNGSRIKKIMPPVEPISGGAIRVSPIANKALLVAEGIETALAGREVYSHINGAPKDMGVWAGISANGLKDIVLPTDGLEQLVICVDADKTFTGQAAAFALANTVVAAKKHHKINLVVVGVPQLGSDMADSIANGTPVSWVGSRIER